MDQNINEILKTIDFYYEILENPEVCTNISSEYMKKIFQACIYIENTIRKIEEEEKEACFESHLSAWMLKKNKNINYRCSDLKNACDKMLEFCLKEKKISTIIIDELLQMYIQQCGSVRLESSINYTLTKSMQANAILQALKNLEFSKTDIEDEILIASWDFEIKLGNKIKVIEYIADMFNKECFSKLIELAYKSETGSSINILILNLFSKKLLKNHLRLYLELKNTKRKVLLKLLADNSQFQVTFVDSTFYFGRSMEYDHECGWITNTGFSYSDLENMIKVFLDGPSELHILIINRIKIAKELDEIWKDIERDCVL
ncbi:PREDICTED: uncharacterized protein LOC105366332 [Ceratosolen solmsi marchali]|uniref:Uncharacterized protein LOC105366332 n=1 Tax=Ceratosolen solmsi marchali TaxID=326594 RepID=A0AAJ7E0C7_9HYME|nr:PREDICTED: uncharacterized protein LOC105366332 [Ceratosolen solmsi marchali]